MNILRSCREDGIHLLHTQKNNRIRQIAPFTQLHCRPECLVCGICPFCPEELPALLRGEYAFLTETPRGGVPKFYGDCPEELPALLRGEYAFLTETPGEGGTKILRRLRGGYGRFPGNYHPPKREILNNPLGLQLCLKVWALFWASTYIERTPDPGSIQDWPLFETSLHCLRID